MANSASQTDDRRRVLDATDIVRLVGDCVTLKPRGREFVCLCPFHDDHKPSMYVVPAKQIYHCFSCGAGGNAIDFVVNYHKMDFLEALKFLADRAGVELAPLRRAASGAAGGPPGDADDAGEPAGRPTRAALAQACQFALDFFRAILRHPQHGAAARAVVERRRISPEMVEAFQVGAAPDRWDGLVRTVESKGLSLAPFVEAGLVKRRGEDSAAPAGFYDAFRNRLIFPIFDQIGRPIAFGGRRIDDAEEPKYLNSPESALFDKGATLFGLHRAFRAIQNQRLAVVTEGYTDAIACHQAGFENVVATLGTALTDRHASVLKRVCDSVVLLFDSDDAGRRAADRALEVFFAEPVDVRIAVLPDAKDPDELLQQPGGADCFRAAISSAQDALDFRFSRLGDRLAGLGLSARSRLVEEDIARLAELGLGRVNPIRRQLIVRRISRLAGVDESVVLASLPGARSARVAPPAPPAPRLRNRLSPIEHALGCLLCDPALRVRLDASEEDLLAPGAYPPGPFRDLAEAFGRVDRAARDAADGQEPSLAFILAEIDDHESRRYATEIASEIDRVTDHNPARLRDHLHASLKSARLQAARREGDAPLEQRPDAVATPPQGHEPGNGPDTPLWIRRIERRRVEHQRFGGDPRALPRPPVPGAVTRAP